MATTTTCWGHVIQVPGVVALTVGPMNKIIYEPICIYVYIYMCVFTYLYRYIYIYISLTHIYIHTHVWHYRIDWYIFGMWNSIGMECGIKLV